MSDMELLLVRIDHFQNRSKYVSVLREWLKELGIIHGRVISMGVHVQLLFVVASEAQNSQLLEFYKSRNIETNSRGDFCVDKFIDVLGRKKVTMSSSSCKGFMEMNVLSPTLLQKVLVHEWQAEQTWLDITLATTRTKAFLEWKEAAIAARKKRRRKEGQEKQQEREVKRIKKEVVQKEQQEAACAKEEEASDNVKKDKPTKIVETSARQPTLTPQLPQKQQQQQQPLDPTKKKMTKKKKRCRAR